MSEFQPLLRRPSSAHRRAADAISGFSQSQTGTTQPEITQSTIPEESQCSQDNAFFLESQVGDVSVMSYSYTDDPWKLLMYDVWYFFQFCPLLPWTVLPLRPVDSGDLDEFASTRGNLFSLFMHGVLIVLQLGFILALPFGFLLPVWAFALAVVAFMALNWLLCLTLNGDTIEFHSDPQYAEARPEHAHEQWIFINGVAAGEHWLKGNLNRIALTFKRPVLGIHNRTSGVIFDVVECLIQRNFGYATNDVRACYRILKQKLYDQSLSKIVFICHSQGAIEGGLVLDWLLQELPQDLLAKLEVYTFGSAANHFNNPYRHIASQNLAKADPQAAEETRITETTQTPVLNPDETSSTLQSMVSWKRGETDTGSPVHRKLPTLRKDSSCMSVRSSSAAHDRVLGHVEHYAHTTDFVAIWGILHFVRRQRASPTIPRFMGRVFVRSSERGGHQFNQHYLDGMFPLERDQDGNLVGAAEENAFMESEVEKGVVGAEHETIKEATEISFLGNQVAANGATGEVPPAEVYGLRGRGRRRTKGALKVKDLCRLWMYRNGKVPVELPPTVAVENGIPRNSTM